MNTKILIENAHRQNLKKVHSDLLNKNADITDYMVAYLSYERDKSLLDLEEDKFMHNNWKKDLKLVSLLWSLDEYNKYKECLLKITQEQTKTNNKTIPNLEQSQKILECQNHLNNFWRSIARYIKLWTE